MVRALFPRSVVFLVAAAGCGDVVTSESTVTIERTGTGAGEFQASLGTVDCSGTACTVTVPTGGTTTITPKPEMGSVFEGWAAGACDNFPTGCQLTLDNDVSLSAAFKLTRASVTVEKSGAGVARITSTPPGIDCGADCVGEFDYGTMVTLTAEMTPGSTFQGWTGPCTGTGDCTFMAMPNAKATAALGCDPGMQTLDYTGALVSLQLPACATAITIDASGAQGGEGGGLGARIKGSFTVPKFSTLSVIVGGAGGGNASSGGGGGGSFVYLQFNAANPLIAAGGGGGKSTNANPPCTPGAGSANSAPTNSTAGAGNAAGGAGTNGGTGGAGCTQTCTIPGTGGGGGGWIGNGGLGQVAAQGGGGTSARNGGAGGVAGSSGVAGGFGGGGGSAGNSGASGGGGGYSGGGGGNGWNGSAWGCGGGGGSFNGGDAATQSNMGGVKSGNGQVIVTW